MTGSEELLPQRIVGIERERYKSISMRESYYNRVKEVALRNGDSLAATMHRLIDVALSQEED